VICDSGVVEIANNDGEGGERRCGCLDGKRKYTSAKAF